MVQKITSIFNTIYKFVNENKFFLPLTCLFLLTLNLFAFIYPVISLPFAIIMLILFALCCIFLNFTNAVSILCFLLPNNLIDVEVSITYLTTIMYFIFIVSFAIKYLIQLIKKENKIHYDIIIITLLLVIQCFVGFKFQEFGKIINILIIFSLFYLFFINYKNLNLNQILSYFIFGVATSCLLGLVFYLVPELNVLVTKYNGRFQGLTKNPNLLQILIIFALSFLIVQFFSNNVNPFSFVILSIILIPFGILTKSKAFLILLVLLLLTFLVLLFIKLIKNKTFVKWGKLKTILFFSGIILLLVVFAIVFRNKIVELFNRLIEFTTVKGSFEDKLNVLTTNRYLVWKDYVNAWLQTPITILFGYGFFAELPNKFALHAHNSYIQLLYNYGLVGTLIFIALIILYCYKLSKKYGFNKQFTNYLPLIMFLMLSLEESIIYNQFLLVLSIFLLFGSKGEKVIDFGKDANSEKNIKIVIPKVIHYIWLGGQPLPKIAEKCIASWKKYCPDYEIKQWDESNLDLEKYQFVKDAINSKKYAFASDVLRTEVLFNEGGIYLDIDVELIKPLDEFLQYDCFMGFETSNLIAPGLIMGTIKNNKNLKNILDVYSTLNFDINNLKNLTICKIYTNYFENLGLKRENSTQKIDNTMFFSSEYFSPIDIVTNQKIITNNTHSIHWYNASWYNSKQKIKSIIKKLLNILSFGLFGKLWLKIQQKK